MVPSGFSNHNCDGSIDKGGDSSVLTALSAIVVVIVVAMVASIVTVILVEYFWFRCNCNVHTRT